MAQRMTGSITLKRAAQPGKDGVAYEIYTPQLGDTIAVNADGKPKTAATYLAFREQGGEVLTLDAVPTVSIGTVAGGDDMKVFAWALPSPVTVKQATVTCVYQGKSYQKTLNVVEDGQNGQDGQDGKQGLQGCVMRRSEWVIGQQYLNEEGVTEDRVRYIDVVGVRATGVATGWRFFKCKSSHTSTADNAPTTDGSPWEEMSNVGAIYTALLLADDAKITFLSGNQIAIQKENGTVTAGVSGYGTGASGIRFWAGSETPGDAPFRVDETGKMVASSAEVTGTINANDGKIGGFNIYESYMQLVNGNTSFMLDRDGVAFTETETSGSSSNKTYASFGVSSMSTILGYQVPAYISRTCTGSNDEQLIGQNILVENTAETKTNGAVALMLSASGGAETDMYTSERTGNHAMYLEKGTITGFRLHVRRVSTSQTLSAMDTVIMVMQKDITITLPTDCEDGQVFWFFSCLWSRITGSSDGLQYLEEDTATIKASKIIYLDGTEMTSITPGGRRSYMFIYDKVNTCWRFMETASSLAAQMKRGYK